MARSGSCDARIHPRFADAHGTRVLAFDDVLHDALIATAEPARPVTPDVPPTQLGNEIGRRQMDDPPGLTPPGTHGAWMRKIRDEFRPLRTRARRDRPAGRNTPCSLARSSDGRAETSYCEADPLRRPAEPERLRFHPPGL